MSEGFRQHSYQPPEGATEIILVRHGELAQRVRRTLSLS